MKRLTLFGFVIIFVIVICMFIYYFFDKEVEISDKTYETELEKVKLLVKEDLKKFNMIKRIRNNKGEERGILEPEINFTKPEKVSHYQNYVTPNHPAIITYVKNNGINSLNDAYTIAVQWTWVSDITLHNKIEWWLKPRALIEDTPDKTLYPNNPVNGIASDCESQAYSLVSIIESTGFSKENVRIVIGLVSFSGETSGHAWVQVYENGKWYELEATSGPYWDDDTNTLVPSSGVGINYFKTRPYPVEKYIAFFNDIYYYQPESGLKTDTLPGHWYTTEKHFSISELKELRKK